MSLFFLQYYRYLVYNLPNLIINFISIFLYGKTLCEAIKLGTVKGEAAFKKRNKQLMERKPVY